MPWLPDTHGRSVRLNLIDIAPLNPHRLALDDGLLDDRRLLNDNRLSDHSGLLHHNRLGHDRRRGLNHNRLGVVRTRQRRPDYAPDHPTDESGPEIPTTRSPVPAVVVMMVPSVMDWRRVMESPMMWPAMPTTGERASRCRHESNCYYEFLHWPRPFSVCE